jgi:hypothetical protein
MQGSQTIWSGHSAEAVASIKKLQDRRLKIIQDHNHGYIKTRVASRLVAAINRKIEEVYNNGEEKQDRRV